MSSWWGEIVRRAIDVVGAGIGLIAASLAMALIALAIHLTSPGSVLVRQRRLGHRGRVFTMLRFRTTTLDGRSTAVGRFLRRWSLDELPQLWNVLRGDMSLVGPGAFGADEAERHRARYPARLSVRPGLRGAWQVHRRVSAPHDDRVRVDLRHLPSRSLSRGLRLLFSSPPATRRPRRGPEP